MLLVFIVITASVCWLLMIILSLSCAVEHHHKRDHEEASNYIALTVAMLVPFLMSIVTAIVMLH